MSFSLLYPPARTTAQKLEMRGERINGKYHSNMAGHTWIMPKGGFMMPYDYEKTPTSLKN
ncbi:MAG: hypothetical protein ACOC3T_03445 [Bacteroidota bacterium]